MPKSKASQSEMTEHQPEMTEPQSEAASSVRFVNIKTAALISLFGTVAVGIAAAPFSYQIIPAQSYGVHIKMGQLVDDAVQPGIYGKWPFFEQYYILNNNTIILETNDIGSGRNTADQNSFTADTRIHYKVNPKVGSIALNIEKITNNHGKDTLKDLQTQALNAVVGNKTASETLAEPEGFMRAFKANLDWRIAQNNLPLELNAVELLDVCIGGNSGHRKVVQMIIRENGIVEQMAGPAAVEIQAGGSTVAPSTVVAQPFRPVQQQVPAGAQPAAKDGPK